MLSGPLPWAGHRGPYPGTASLALARGCQLAPSVSHTRLRPNLIYTFNGHTRVRHASCYCTTAHAPSVSPRGAYGLFTQSQTFPRPNPPAARTECPSLLNLPCPFAGVTPPPIHRQALFAHSPAHHLAFMSRRHPRSPLDLISDLTQGAPRRWLAAGCWLAGRARSAGHSSQRSPPRCRVAASRSRYTSPVVKVQNTSPDGQAF